MPNVNNYRLGVYDQYYGSGRSVLITTKGGYEYYFAGYGYMIEYIKEAGLRAYTEWVENYYN